MIFQSGMFDSCDSCDEGDEIFPTLLLRTERLAPCGRERVIPAAALLGLLHPAAGDPAFGLEPMEQGIERRHVKAQRAAGARLDQLGDVVAVARLIFEQGEDQKFGAALFPILIGRRSRHIRRSLIWDTTIVYARDAVLF